MFLPNYLILSHLFLGVPVFLVVAVTGLSPNDKASFSHVTLLGPKGESLLKVLLNSSSSYWSGEELVGYMNSVPRMPFTMCLSGKDGRGNLLERVSTEMIQPTHVQIQVLVNLRIMRWQNVKQQNENCPMSPGALCSTTSPRSQLDCAF